MNIIFIHRFFNLLVNLKKKNSKKRQIFNNYFKKKFFSKKRRNFNNYFKKNFPQKTQNF